MDDITKKPEEDFEIKPGQETGESLETKETAPKKEMAPPAELDEKKLKDEMAGLDFADTPKPGAGATAKAVSPEQEEKIKMLLEMAKKKGVVEAVAAAKKINDPYLLDIFHDVLAKEGLYKKFKE